jgi:hypothetical protein
MTYKNWNYRVFHNAESEGFGIVECYYNNQDEPIVRSEGFMKPYGETPVELHKNLERMLSAFKKPILTEKDFTDET